MTDSHKMRRVKITELTTPKDGLYDIMIDRWWSVSGDDEVYFFGTDPFPFASPQCNIHKEIVDRISKGLAESERVECRYENFKETRQIPLIYRPINLAEYM